MKNRRKLLKAFTVVSSAGVVSDWKKPIVNSIVLPAHAQFTPTCASDPITIDIDDTDTFGLNDSVQIIFDGNTCSLVQKDENRCINGMACDPDTMLLIDNDASDGAFFDIPLTTGSNWANFGGDDGDLSPATYTRTNTRTSGPNNGVSYDVTFTVAISGSSMTVSNVSFVVSP